MVVDLLGRLDAPMPQSVPHIVQRVSLLRIHHPIGDTVSKRVGCHVIRVTTGPIDRVRLNTGLLSNLRDRVPNVLSSDTVARP